MSVCCVSRGDGIMLHIDEVEPVNSAIQSYGFTQQIKAIIVKKDITPTTDKLGTAADLLLRDSL